LEWQIGKLYVVVKGTCKRLSEEERRALLVVFRLMRDDKYEGVPQVMVWNAAMKLLTVNYRQRDSHSLPYDDDNE